MAGNNPLLTNQPLGNNNSFNGVFLVEYITIGILTIWFLFYFNRVFSAVVSYAIRLFTWHTLGIYLDIESLQISLLAGRIFFKGVRYHGENETILVHGGYITWQYWLGKVKESELFQDDDDHRAADDKSSSSRRASSAEGHNVELEEQGVKPHPKDLPCRISVKVSGVEAFCHNRSPAYDLIIDSVSPNGSEKGKSKSEEELGHDAGAVNRPKTNQTASSSPSEDYIKNERENSAKPSQRTGNPSQPTDNFIFPTPPSILRLLPVHVEVNKAAMVLGNENTPSIITAKIDSASGEFDAGKAQPLDVFKILMGFDIIRPVVKMKPNADYKRPQLAEAESLKQNDSQPGKSKSKDTAMSGNVWRKALSKKTSWGQKWQSLPGLSKAARKSLDSVVNLTPLISTLKLPDARPEPAGHNRWIGLGRYLEEEQREDHDEWGDVEYAKASNIAELDAVHFKFFWDIPGKASSTSLETRRPMPRHAAEINVSAPPEYGMELNVKGGRVHYGPWADRHRLILQQIFFPPPFADARPTPFVKSGEPRICSVFKLFLSIDGETILRVPFREPSKDWRFKDCAEAVTGKGRRRTHSHAILHRSRKRSAKRAAAAEKLTQTTDARPYAWFDIKVQANSTISYVMDQYPCTEGYKNELSVNVSGVEIYSSLNHALLWRSRDVALACQLPYPLAWNGLREWIFDITISRLDLYLLRDHTFLLVDLIEDWSAGPLADFSTFVPYRYILNTNFKDFKLFLNVNDANLVNNSDDPEDNDFVILYGGTLNADLVIPIDGFRPAQSEITFDVEAHDLGFELSLPPKNTLSALLAHKDVAQLPTVLLNGTYGLCSEVRPDLTETLIMTIHGKGLSVDFYGFFARQLAKIKENYFGDDVHFRTYEEFQELLAAGTLQPSNTMMTSTKSNNLDVILDITAEDGCIKVPSGIYDCDEYIELIYDIANVDLRVNNYYLELQVDSTPVHIGYQLRDAVFIDSSPRRTVQQITIDSVHCFGHRLFGLPPVEPAYVSNWDIDVGDIVGDFPVEFIGVAIAAAKSIALTITDEENGLPLPPTPLVHDTTFVRFQCSMIRLWLRIADVAMLMSTENISGTFNDFAGNRFSQSLTMSVPGIHMACIDAKTLSGAQDKSSRLTESYGFLQTAMSFQMIQRGARFADDRAEQQKHIAKHDQRSQRAQFLLETPNEQAGLPIPLCLPSLPVAFEAALKDRHRPTPANPTRQGRSHNQPQSATYATDLSDYVAAATLDGDGSVLKMPRLPLDDLKADLQGMPQLPQEMQRPKTNAPVAHTRYLDDTPDEDAIHTSLIISTDPGIALMCKPQLVQAVSDLMQTITPRSPWDVFDEYQAETISEVISLLTRKRGKRSIIDMNITVPSMQVKFIHPDPERTATRTRAWGDEYNVTSGLVTTMVRIKNLPERQHAEDLKAVHITVAAITASIRPLATQQANIAAAIECKLDDVLVWLADSDRLIVHASHKMLEIAIASKDLQYLASLVHRTVITIDRLRAPFLSLISQRARRRRFLVYKLVQSGDSVADPPFLTRPSYMIRSAKDHLRNSDSWKIIARLRWILKSMQPSARHDLLSHMVDDRLETPSDSETYVLSSLDQWRSWDALHVKDSIAMRILFPSRAGVTKLHDRSNVPVSVISQSVGILFVVDTGRKRNEVRVDNLALAMSITPPPPRSAMQLFQEYQEVRTMLVQVTTSRVSVDLKWELIELADQIVTLFEHNALGQTDLVSASPNSLSARYDAPAKEELHIVISSESADLNFEAIHLSQSLASSGLKVSVAVIGSGERSEDMCINVVASAQDSSMAMRRDDRSIWCSNATSSSLCIALAKLRSNGRTSDTLHLTALGNKGSFHLDEDFLGVLEVADLVLKHEVQHVQALVRKYSGSRKHQGRTSAQADQTAPIKLHLAMLMEEYAIGINVLPEIRYTIEGKVARSSILSDPSADMNYQATFDLKGQSHRLIGGDSTTSQTIASFGIPPINGSARALIEDSINTLSGSAAMEQISLQGIDIYGIITLLTAPAVATGLESIKADVATIKKTAQSLQASQGTSRSSPHPSPFVKKTIFDAAFVLTGLTVCAQVPASSRQSEKAELKLALSATRLRLANRSAERDMALPFPEMTVALGKLDCDLIKHTTFGREICGNAHFAASLSCTVDPISETAFRRDFNLSAVGPVIEVQVETAPLLVEIIAHFQDRLSGLDVSREKNYLRRLRGTQAIATASSNGSASDKSVSGVVQKDKYQYVSTFSFNMRTTQVSYWESARESRPSSSAPQLLLSLAEVSLLAKSEEQASLRIEQVQIEVVTSSESGTQRAKNSALLPDVSFEVQNRATETERSLRLRAEGKALDLQLEPGLVKPIAVLERSLTQTISRTKAAIATLQTRPSTTDTGVSSPQETLFGNRPIGTVTFSADFAGAVIRLQGHKSAGSSQSLVPSLRLETAERHSRYGQFVAGNSTTGATIRAPGIVVKARYINTAPAPALLSAEVRIEGSSNSLTPAVVPLLAQTFHNVKKEMREAEENKPSRPTSIPAVSEEPHSTGTDSETAMPADPSAILGRTRLNIGFRICKQEFTMSCQPIAKVVASAKLEDVYLTINTVESGKTGNFFALSATFTKLQAALQHVYSREATFVFDVESLTLSMMNSKHTSGVAGVSAILNINPIKAQLNGKQLQDLLLFREIWVPPEIRNSPLKQQTATSDEPGEYFVRRYHQIAASTAFPWNATVALAGLHIEMDLGQAIGKLSADLSDLWASSKKNTRAQQTLCVGVDHVGVEGTGRMSGFVQLRQLKLRTSIAWAANDVKGTQTPLIQGSVGFEELRLKAAFDYQVFAIAHITALDFIVYNVRDQQQSSGDRLVALLDGGKVHVYCVAASAALAVSLVQAFERLVEEKKASYDQSLKDVDSFLHRKSSAAPDHALSNVPAPLQRPVRTASSNTPLRLHTDVVVTLGSLDVGAFPRTMLDNQLLKLEAVDVQARFAAAPEGNKLHSGLGLTLGQVRAALAEIPRQGVPKTLGEVAIEDVVKSAASARGGVILRVPRVKATMQTWQASDSKCIDYKFKSTFEGKIDVGWNYSRISFIRGMWETHCRTLASRLGKPLPQSALRITGPPSVPEQRDGALKVQESEEQHKITAVVNLPQSKYTYRALEPPVIDTPQLRDMGEATPPLEWIGLNRDKLPNVTHQVVIVTLLEVVKEVEDAYTQVLGSA